jgi:hypothetical protein
MSFFNARIPKRREEKRRRRRIRKQNQKAICTPLSSLFLRGSLKSKSLTTHSCFCGSMDILIKEQRWCV